jgi:hypothetical protein
MGPFNGSLQSAWCAEETSALTSAALDAARCSRELRCDDAASLTPHADRDPKSKNSILTARPPPMAAAMKASRVMRSGGLALRVAQGRCTPRTAPPPCAALWGAPTPGRAPSAGASWARLGVRGPSLPVRHFSLAAVSVGWQRDSPLGRVALRRAARSRAHAPANAARSPTSGAPPQTRCRRLAAAVVAAAGRRVRAAAVEAAAAAAAAMAAEAASGRRTWRR